MKAHFKILYLPLQVPQIVLELEDLALLVLLHILSMSDIVMQLLDITSEDVVVVADLVEVRASVVDLDVALFDSPLYLLNLIIDLNTLFLALMNALIDVVLVALEMRDDLGLVSKTLLIFLARLLDLVL